MHIYTHMYTIASVTVLHMHHLALSNEELHIRPAFIHTHTRTRTRTVTLHHIYNTTTVIQRTALYPIYINEEWQSTATPLHTLFFTTELHRISCTAQYPHSLTHSLTHSLLPPQEVCGARVELHGSALSHDLSAALHHSHLHLQVARWLHTHTHTHTYTHT